MLSCTGVEPSAAPRIVLDSNVPLTIRWPAAPAKLLPFLWIAGDSDRALLEIAAHPVTRSIQRLALVLGGYSVVTTLEASDLQLPRLSGVPILDDPEWLKERTHREDVAFRVCVSRRLTLELGQPATIASVLVAGQVSCGIDERNVLRRVEVEGLAKGEVEAIGRALESQRESATGARLLRIGEGANGVGPEMMYFGEAVTRTGL